MDWNDTYIRAIWKLVSESKFQVIHNIILQSLDYALMLTSVHPDVHVLYTDYSYAKNKIYW